MIKKWIEVGSTSEFENNDRKLVDLGGEKQIALFKLEDGYYAVGAWCSHQKRSLLEGPVDDHEIMCPLHGARFDLKTGQPLSFPAVKPITQYPVKVEHDTIYLKA